MLRLTFEVVEALEQAVPQQRLVFSASLTEGNGQEIKSSVPAEQPIKTTGQLAWSAEGKLGPAPAIKSGATLEVGDVGNFRGKERFSFGAWIKPAKKDASVAIIARMDEEHNHRGWDLYQSAGKLSVHIVDSWPDRALKVSTKQDVVDPKQWQHVFVTYNGSGKPAGIKIYVDGKEEPHTIDTKSLKANASIETKTPLRIGQRSSGAVFFDVDGRRWRQRGRHLWGNG